MAAKKRKMEDKGAKEVDWTGLAPEVLKMIFVHLPVKDLLSCSVMSKSWKRAARDVLKSSRECYAHIKDFHRDTQNLNVMIASSGLMEMVNGLHIQNEFQSEDESGSASSSSSQETFLCYDVKNARQTEQARKKLERAKKTIHQVLCVKWRYLSLNIGRPLEPALSNSDDALLLREVIFATSGSLEKLVIGQVEDWELIPCNGNEYSKLRVIQLLNEQFQHDINTKILSPTFAPKLEEITGAMIKLSTCMMAQPEANFPMDGFTMKRMKSILLWPDLWFPEGKAKEALEYISGLRRLDLQKFHYSESEYFESEYLEELEPWNAIIFPFVLRSLDTLEELYMYTYDLYKLVKASDALKLPNLRRLSLAAKPEVFELEKQISALKQLNLAELCPNLKQVELAGESTVGETTIEVMRTSEAFDWLEQNSLPMHIVLDCKDKIYGKHLQQYLTFFNAIYPNAAQVRILKLMEFSVFEMGSIIWEMNSLEYLEINIQRPWFCWNDFPLGLDAFMCGINIEEAELLLNQNAAVIVPIRPSVFSTKSLKELKITEEDSGREATVVEDSFVIQITDNYPVHQVRKMKVTFEGSENFYDQLKELRTFSMFLSAQVREI